MRAIEKLRQVVAQDLRGKATITQRNGQEVVVISGNEYFLDSTESCRMSLSFRVLDVILYPITAADVEDNIFRIVSSYCGPRCQQLRTGGDLSRITVFVDLGDGRELSGAIVEDVATSLFHACSDVKDYLRQFCREST